MGVGSRTGGVCLARIGDGGEQLSGPLTLSIDWDMSQRRAVDPRTASACESTAALASGGRLSRAGDKLSTISFHTPHKDGAV